MQSIKAELARKTIHFLGIGYIPLYFYTGREITLTVVLSLTVFAFFVEFLKFRYDAIPEWILRDHELEGIGSHLYTGISISIITVLLPMEACFVAIACAILGDGVSGIVKRYNKKLSVILMFLSPLILIHFLSNYVSFNMYSAILACFVGTFFDNFSEFRGHYINDNFSIPLASSLVYTLFG